MSEIRELFQAAKAAVAAVVGLPLGERVAQLRDRAESAFQAAVLAAQRRPFPAFVRAGADAIAMFGFVEASALRLQYAAPFVEAHEAALDSDPLFAEFLRSELVCRRIASVEAAAGQVAAPDAHELARSAASVDAYRAAIVRQLVGRAEFEPEATLLAIELPELRARLDAALAAHQAHADAARQRIEAEAAARDAAVAAAVAAARADRIAALRSTVERLQGVSITFAVSVARSSVPEDVPPARVLQMLKGTPSDAFLESLERQLAPFRVQTSAQPGVQTSALTSEGR